LARDALADFRDARAVEAHQIGGEEDNSVFAMQAQGSGFEVIVHPLCRTNTGAVPAHVRADRRGDGRLRDTRGERSCHVAIIAFLYV
jgi:hypothetical protein